MGRLRLMVVTGPDQGRVLVPDGDVVVGRDRECGWVLQDETVSRRHFRIAGGRRPVLEDLGSANGTLVNGKPAASHVLAPGDRIRLGDTDMIVVAEPKSSPEGSSGSTIRLAETPDELLIGTSAAIWAVRDTIRRVAPTSATVLVRGETGTGKELVARAIHQKSPRAAFPFIVVDCTVLHAELLQSELFGHEKGAFTGAHARKRGSFELAHGGTIFFDELGELSADVQAMLLRVLETGRFQRLGGTDLLESDVRVVAATNVPLEEAVEKGAFREDLYYRLNVVPLELPPLRDRRSDIPALCRHLLSISGSTRSVARAAAACMERYAWPGNVRELKNALERGAILSAGPEIQPADLPPAISGLQPQGDLPPGSSTSPLQSLKDLERDQIRRVLQHTGGNKKEAARILGIQRNTLYEKMRRYGL